MATCQIRCLMRCANNSARPSWGISRSLWLPSMLGIGLASLSGAFRGVTSQPHLKRLATEFKLESRLRAERLRRCVRLWHVVAGRQHGYTVFPSHDSVPPLALRINNFNSDCDREDLC